jgi:predicted RNase H-like HicB family nuclease
MTRDTGATPLHAVLFPIVVEANDDGFLARSPNIQGAFAEGDTIEEAIFNCVDVIKMVAAYRAERGESPPPGLIEVTPDIQLAISIPIEIPT